MFFKLESQPLLIVLSSPSGGGKSSVCQALLRSDDQLAYSVSMTSRPPRGEEVNGRDYHFVSEEEFHRRIGLGHFYEWAKVHDHFYGTPKEHVDAQLAAGHDVVLDLDIVGGLNLKKATVSAVLVFILPPSFEVLEARLRGRKTDSEDEIQKRLRNARSEMNFVQKYDFAVVNDSLDETIVTIRRIIEAERHAVKHQKIISGE